MAIYKENEESERAKKKIFSLIDLEYVIICHKNRLLMAYAS
ncbi:hypothetical protein ACWKWW_20175 [Chryseobacterium cucumeris]